MQKWSLRADPSPHDAARFALFVKGDMKDVSSVIKKFGAMCGRPARVEHPEGYNFRLHLHGLTQLGLEQVSGYLEGSFPGTCADRPAPAPPAAAPPRRTEPVPAPEPSPQPEAEPAKPPDAASAPAAEPAAQLVSLEPSLAAPAAKAAPPPVASGLAVPPARAVPGIRPQAEAPARAPGGLRQEIDPRLNLETLMVGAYNRFAHAAATSVIGSPGTMYNPLFVFGPPAVGKTHVLHAVAAALEESLGSGTVVLTSGAGLASAANRAAAEGRLKEFEAPLEEAQALLIDDTHLLAVSEANAAVLSRVLNAFFSRNRQVVMSSVYPPRALTFMEEALKISLAKGWAVDMKLPNPAVRAEIVGAQLTRCGVVADAELIGKLVEELGANYGEFPRIATRWAAMAKLCRKSGQQPAPADICAHLTAPGARTGESDLPAAAELEAARGFQLPSAGADARNLAVFLPKGQEGAAGWILSRFHKTGGQFNIVAPYKNVLQEAYDPDQPFGVPFQIGEACRRGRAGCALVLGPSGESKLAQRVGEFAHAVRHVVEDGGTALGWIPFNETTITRPFLAAHLDFLAFPRP